MITKLYPYTTISGIFLLLLLSNCGSTQSSNSITGIKELKQNVSSNNTTTAVASQSDTMNRQEDEQLIAEGWAKGNYTNGILPECYDYVPQFSQHENELSISVGMGTNVALKLMSVTTGKCIRYVFINSSSTYAIRNIPPDSYYVKVAYGEDWISKSVEGSCKGKFHNNTIYEKGEKVYAFSGKHRTDKYQKFALSLDVVEGSTEKTINASRIAEAEFND